MYLICVLFRQYWLQQLQRGRREYTQNAGANNRMMARSSVRISFRELLSNNVLKYAGFGYLYDRINLSCIDQD